MIANSLAYAVFRKELRETLRDKRVILGVIVSPLVVTPLILGTILFFAGKKEFDKSTSTLTIGIVEKGSFPELVERIESNPLINARRYESREIGEQALRDREARAIIVISKEARANFQANRSAGLEIIYDFANEKSQNAQSRLQRLIGDFDKEALAERIQNENLSEEFAHPTVVKAVNIATGESTGAFVLGIILPYLVVISAAFGGIQTAFDLCAGEKERGTMETLLVSPASRSEIVSGKLMTVFCISLIASFCALAGIILPLSLGLEMFKDTIADTIAINLTSTLTMLVIVIPLALLTSSLLLVISSFARNQKEAQTYILPFISIILFPAMLSSILGVETQLYTAFIPVLNISLTMKQVLASLFDPLYFFIALSSSFVYALIIMRLATALFQREQILFRA